MGALLLKGCSVEIKNERWYGDLGSQGAVWYETLSSDTGTVDKKSWDEMRIGMACTTLDTIADIKKEIEKLCSYASCSYELKRAFSDLETRLESFQARTLSVQ